MYNFAKEGFDITASNVKADILVELQGLLKNSSQCQRRTFEDCLRGAEKNIAADDRCALPNGSCNPEDRYCFSSAQ